MRARWRSAKKGTIYVGSRLQDKVYANHQQGR